MSCAAAFSLLVTLAASVTPAASQGAGDAAVLRAFLTSLPPVSQRVLLPSWNATTTNTSDTGPSHCAFLGVQCTATGAVAAVNLSGQGLSGELAASAPRLCALRALATLDLSLNSFTGAVPAALAACSELATLELSNNSLSGAIPPEVAALPGLAYLSLSGNGLSGPVPEFPLHCRLQYLSLYGNQITGELPLEPRQLRQPHRPVPILQQDRGHPARFLRLPDQAAEALPQQQLFTGTIPAVISNLSRLQWLTIKDTFVTGEIPPEIGKCQELVILDLQNNNLTGVIPPEIAELKKLQWLSLYRNMLHGPVPAALWQMPQLERLALYNNSLSGEIPAEINHMSSLRDLLLAFNSFTGELPQDLGLNTTHGLVWVDVMGNHFHGKIPPGLCTGGQLAILDLALNRFSGSIPSEIIKCQSLWRARLGNNMFNGSLPSDLGINTGWSYVELGGNQFEGKIPSVLGSWQNLTVLDLSRNSFSGPIPPELGALTLLGNLNLSSNKLSGPIPHELGNCRRLVRLDLQNNLLNGTIPAEIISLSSLQHLVLSGNKLSGEIPDAFTSTQGLLELQLGSNSLEGAIPWSLGKLQFISQIINISSNMLSGTIPSSLGNLQMLEMLDLSKNSLSGPIPSQLSNMISLSAVNMSFNQLSGLLPAGWVKLAEHSPKGFLGNPQLCIQSENSPCSKNQSRRRIRRNTRIIIALLLSSLAVMVSGLCAIHYMVKRSRRRLLAKHVSVRGLDTTEELPEDLTYDDILRATDNWSEKYVIGRGRHGTVYRTELAPGRQWAVKTVDLSQIKFPIEMKILNMVKHRNIVKMEGYCIRGNFGVILSDYMPEGTLFELLHGRKPQVPLDWKVRHQIALGAAQGLSYLHHDCVPMIVHRDVKSSNILMDADLVPKIADFGMGKIVGDEDADATVSVVIGTLGYIAPEHGYNTRLTEKSDVYSYGVVLLELLCRKMPVDPAFGDGVDIVAWMRLNLKHADYCSVMSFLDEEIMYWPEDEKAKALDLLDLAISCTQVAFESRLSMREVVSTLMRIDDQYNR
ncbi:unnamed protein product [Miscanthus lutarioriparius]|uniref:Protein kinase domain-containing protein n=1 Tax=Miscanthus lutarioriparius TaxID=422564 RepID=A0A811SNP3_9POAL|nr:unnamed protein product [Miscanthus lutarioriparius]